MSADPQAMAMLLGGLQQPQSQGGQQAQVSPLGGAAQLAQKIMLMQALQKGQPQQPQQPTGYLPGQPQPQQMNAQPIPGAINA